MTLPCRRSSTIGDLVTPALERDLMVFAADLDPPRPLVHGGYIPAGLLAVGSAHVDLAIDDQGPHQGRGAVGDAVLPKGEMYSAIARRSSSFQELMVVRLFLLHLLVLRLSIVSQASS
jgi:hypothetical protein